MANIFTKKKSKRMTCRRRYKIERKIREHNRKKRKAENKKDRKAGDKALRIKKLERVPNKCPFKEQILEEAEKWKQEAEKLEMRLKEERKRRKSETESSLTGLVASAAKRAKNFDDLQELTENDLVIRRLQKQEDFKADLRRVIKLSDIVLEVLDARDPLGSRSMQVEKMILDAGKRLILVINKIDLIPKDNLKQWLSYLRKEYPTIAFKSSTQEQKTKLGWLTCANVLTSKAIGADWLMRLLGSYIRKKETAAPVRVGVVGYPNVGKSSIINSLKRKVACKVGAHPGVTRSLQEVQLDKLVRLMDSPGVVLASPGSMDPSELALKNVIAVDNVKDLMGAGEAILRRCSKDRLMILYNLPEFNTYDEFFALLAKRMGKLRKGGVPDRKMAARRLLSDWNSGKIRYYCEPPDDTDRVISSEIVDRMCKEFDIDSINDDEKLVLESLPVNLPADALINLNSDLGNNEPMECDQDAIKIDIDASSERLGKKGKRMPNRDSAEDPFETEGNRRDNYLLKQLVKKRKRRMRKTENRCSKLANAMETVNLGSLNEAEDYNFEEAFANV